MNLSSRWKSTLALVHRLKVIMREFLRRPISLQLVMAVWGSILAILSIALYFSTFPLYYQFSEILTLLATIWSAGILITSDSVEKYRQKTRRQMKGKDPYSNKRYRIAQAIRIIPALAFGAVFFWFIHGVQIKVRLRSFGDSLSPGNLPTPPNACTGMDKRWLGDHPILVLLGPMAAISSMRHQNVIVINQDKILQMDRSRDGAVTVSTEIYDSNHDIVAEIDKNHYDVDSHVYKLERKNLSDLRITIRHDKEEVLNVQYLNPDTISITGVFRTKTDTLRVDKNNAFLDGSLLPFHDVCSGNSGAADFYFRTDRALPH
jgi:hypothetical protein